MKFFRKIYFAIFLLFIIASCNKDKVDLSKITSNHYVAIPLVSGNIGIDDILKEDTNSLVNTSADGEIFLVYTTDTLNFSVDELGITLPDIAFNLPIPSPSSGGVPTNSGDSVIIDSSVTQSILIDLNGITPELKLIELNTGNLSVVLTNGLSHEVRVIMTFPSILDPFGNPYSDTKNINANSVKTTGVPLNGYQLDLTQGNLGYNEVIIDVNFTIICSGQSLSSSEQLDIDFSMIGVLNNRDQVSPAYINDYPDELKGNKLPIKLKNNISNIDFSVDLTDIIKKQIIDPIKDKILDKLEEKVREKIRIPF